jgi:hypothetical protein
MRSGAAAARPEPLPGCFEPGPVWDLSVYVSCYVLLYPIGAVGERCHTSGTVRNMLGPVSICPCKNPLLVWCSHDVVFVASICTSVPVLVRLGSVTENLSMECTTDITVTRPDVFALDSNQARFVLVQTLPKKMYVDCMRGSMVRAIFCYAVPIGLHNSRNMFDSKRYTCATNDKTSWLITCGKHM